jgi:UPF0755 protein
MKHVKRRSKIFLIIAIIIVAIAGYFAYVVFGPATQEPEGKYFYINTGDSYEKVRQRLQEKKVLTSTQWFDRVSSMLDYDKLVKPGRYKIDEGMSLFTLVRMLRAGEQSPVRLVLVKLRTKEDLAAKIGNNFECDSAVVAAFLNNEDSLKEFNLDSHTVMTAIIPNTYEFNWNTTPSKLFRRLYTERQKFWNNERKAKARALGLTPEEVYTMASIVEEETNKQEDKGKIASVYLNRIRTGMKLAADPTVKFAMRDFALKRIYHKHLAYPSAYNTYLVAGLPPGPICTPSVKTIDAVLNAPKTDYLFFVARADFSGYSDFAATYDQHLRYAKAYQQALDREMAKRDSMKNRR